MFVQWPVMGGMVLRWCQGIQLKASERTAGQPKPEPLCAIKTNVPSTRLYSLKGKKIYKGVAVVGCAKDLWQFAALRCKLCAATRLCGDGVSIKFYFFLRLPNCGCAGGFEDRMKLGCIERLRG